MKGMYTATLTFNFRDRAEENVPLSLLIFQASQNLLDNRLGQVRLFALLQLLLIANPAVQHRLNLRGESDLLLLDEDLRFKLSSFLRRHGNELEVQHRQSGINTYLGESKETFGQGDDILHLVDGINAVFDGLRVLSTGTSQDISNPSNLRLSPLLVRFPYHLALKSQNA